MKAKAIYKVVGGFTLGFSVGIAYYGQMLGDTVNETMELMQRDQWINAKGYLGLAKLLRDEEFDDALHATESLISLSVRGFTDDRELEGLSEHELSTLAKIKTYRDQKCMGNCLVDLTAVLESEPVRITSLGYGSITAPSAP